MLSRLGQFFAHESSKSCPAPRSYSRGAVADPSPRQTPPRHTARPHGIDQWTPSSLMLRSPVQLQGPWGPFVRSTCKFPHTHTHTYTHTRELPSPCSCVLWRFNCLPVHRWRWMEKLRGMPKSSNDCHTGGAETGVSVCIVYRVPATHFAYICVNG
ncbi:hypothetical protein CCHR01_10086 [Colletotrichum chrysophilum]|uniref:Uncharacterized protein n=1 Tax=Colletotrichum chrysophilum TaxID=1836956 RepID=A0AAD9AFL3_9PEZI|nr:hypothetical protein K456DRAFT_89904 [Colletotrichum gloeosporioides 23]KAK1847296.1 hypothetical protein CCHR01_10086 [Colletotrichum chrysophilum]